MAIPCKPNSTFLKQPRRKILETKFVSTNLKRKSTWKCFLTLMNERYKWETGLNLEQRGSECVLLGRRRTKACLRAAWRGPEVRRGFIKHIDVSLKREHAVCLSSITWYLPALLPQGTGDAMLLSRIFKKRSIHGSQVINKDVDVYENKRFFQPGKRNKKKTDVIRGERCTTDVRFRWSTAAILDENL